MAHPRIVETGWATLASSPPQDIMAALGRYDGITHGLQFGLNTDIDTATAPEDLWGGGGVYTGFPVDLGGACSVVSTSASDTGRLTVRGLKTPTSTAYETESVFLNGTTPVALANSWYRINLMDYSGTATTFNLGTISAYRTAVPATVFCTVQIGRSRSKCGAYTVPAGSTAYITSISMDMVRQPSGATQYAAGDLWFRSYLGTARMLTPVECGSNTPYRENFLPGAVPIASLSDIIIRVSSVSANDTAVAGGFQFYLVRNI